MSGREQASGSRVRQASTAVVVMTHGDEGSLCDGDVSKDEEWGAEPVANDRWLSDGPVLGR